MDNMELLSVSETADQLKISRETGWRWRRNAQLPAAHLCRRWKIRREELLEGMIRHGLSDYDDDATGMWGEGSSKEIQHGTA